MKIFSMLFTVLFFVSFASFASAEPVYTITNDSDEAVAIFPDENVYQRSVYGLAPNSCLQIKESDFERLNIVLVSKLSSLDLMCEKPCPPNNYLIITKTRFFMDNHVMEIINVPNKGCYDFNQWLDAMEQFAR